ncbi:MAG TPA: TAXI family TRAP transporter solute-binding subunit, partial [Alphaproteobacteria bacterium]|nr:TAXI family TRAP transporter solute-binding subunit [Alphaproteobacteria bacterium]
GWNRLSIPANSYPDQSEAVPIGGFAMHMIAHCEEMPEDTAYKVVKAIAENVEDLGSVNRALADFTTKDLARDVGMPMHPGAERYYKEVGAL